MDFWSVIDIALFIGPEAQPSGPAGLAAVQEERMGPFYIRVAPTAPQGSSAHGHTAANQNASSAAPISGRCSTIREAMVRQELRLRPLSMP